MKTILLLIVLQIMFYRSVCGVGGKNDKGSVIFVNLLWRHGERTPTTFYVNDRYKDESYWPEGIGQLTNFGKRQHLQLGQWLRKRYDDLLTDEYSASRVYVQSTDVDRTIMSALSNLAGMYPPKGLQVWEKRLPWQPIPVHDTPEGLDKVLAAKVPCPAYDQEFARVMESKDIKEIFNKYHDLLDVLSENAGGDVYDFTYIHDIWDTLTIEKRSGYSLPEWAEDILPRLYEIAKYKFSVDTWTKKLGRLKAGLLIQEIIENMTNRTQNNSDRVLNVYSAHDVTIANLLNTLGVFDGNIPMYASCVIMELREDSHGRYYVTLFYRYSDSENPQLLAIPGCSPVCPLDKFISLTQPLIPEDWEKECQLS